MKSHQLQQPTLITRQANMRRWQWFGLSLIGIIITLAVSLYAATGRDSQVRVTQSAAIDPAAQGVNGYLRAHANVEETMALDPAAQGVTGYLNAHRAAQTSAIAADPAVQGVTGYLNAHRFVQTRPLDAATQSVLDYLRVHSVVLSRP